MNKDQSDSIKGKIARMYSPGGSIACTARAITPRIARVSGV